MDTDLTERCALIDFCQILSFEGLISVDRLMWDFPTPKSRDFGGFAAIPSPCQELLRSYQVVMADRVSEMSALLRLTPLTENVFSQTVKKMRSNWLRGECEVRAMKYIPGSGSADFLGFDTLKTKAALIGWLGLMLSVLIPAPVMSQQIGDAEKGKQYALEFCTGCHAVDPAQPLSPLPKAPRFEDVANTPGMTAISLTAWFQTSHPTMPNIVMTDAQMRNVIQYILSLKSD